MRWVFNTLLLFSFDFHSFSILIQARIPVFFPQLSYSENPNPEKSDSTKCSDKSSVLGYIRVTAFVLEF